MNKQQIEILKEQYEYLLVESTMAWISLFTSIGMILIFIGIVTTPMSIMWIRSIGYRRREILYRLAEVPPQKINC